MDEEECVNKEVLCCKALFLVTTLIYFKIGVILKEKVEFLLPKKKHELKIVLWISLVIVQF